MPLTAVEQAELMLLESQVGTLTPEEQAELKLLESSTKPTPSVSTGDIQQLYKTRGIGAVSAKYESTDRGHVVAPNKKDGTMNYGRYQIHQMNIPKILVSAKEQYPAIVNVLGKHKPGTPAFKQAWESLAASDPVTFDQFQQDMATQHFFEPGLQAYAGALGVDPGSLSEAERMAVSSASIQHGGYAKIFKDAAKSLPDGATPSQRLDALYQARTRYEPEFKNRYAEEREDVRPFEGTMASVEKSPSQSGLPRFRGMPAPAPSSDALAKQAGVSPEWLGQSYFDQADMSKLGDAAGSTVGEAGMRALGTTVAPAFGPAAPLIPPIFSGIGAAGGLYASRKTQGKPVSAGELAVEGLMSALPDAIVDPIVAGLRKTVSRTKAAIRTSTDWAGEWLLKQGPEWFSPVPKQFLDSNVQILSQAGAKIEAASLANAIKSMKPETYNRIIKEIPSISSGLKGQFPKAGERAKAILELMRNGTSVSAIDLSWLIHLRTQATRTGRVNRNVKDQAALDQLGRIIDEVIEGGHFRAGSPLPDVQKEVTRHYRRYKESQNFAEFLERNAIVTRTSGNKYWTIDLGKLAKTLRHPGDDRLAEAVQQSFLRPENKDALKQLEEFSEKLSGYGIDLAESVTHGKTPLGKKRSIGVVNIEGAASSDPSFLSQFLATMLTVPMARERFMRIVAHKRGTIALEDIVVLANWMRRSTEPLNSYLYSIGQEKEQELRDFMQQKWEGMKNTPTYRSIEQTFNNMGEQKVLQ